MTEQGKQEAEQYNNGWISCSEPPKTSDYILRSFSNFSVPMVGRYEENEDGGAYYIGDEDKSCVSQDIFVNAWQPLPKPYQPKKDRENCKNRHENGNCLAIGGFCTSVDDKYCKYQPKGE